MPSGAISATPSTNARIKHKQRLYLPTALALTLVTLLASACVEEPPADALNYENCLSFHAEPIPPTGDDDPHFGFKSVYGCNVDAEALTQGPVSGYPDGTLIVKTAVRDDQDFPWLLATMRKINGSWEWAEYTRNFADESFAKLSIDDAVCTDCHAQVEAIDWVFSVYHGAE